MRTGAEITIWPFGLFLLFLLPSLFSPVSVQAATDQPLAFSHKIHVEQYKMDCQYCHPNARRSPVAGIPSVARCWGCHKITAADKPEVKKIHEYWNKKEPIPWVRVYKLPGYVYFTHKRHVLAGVKCQTCHGPVETMTTVTASTGRGFVNDLVNLTGLTPAPPPLTMGWCVECHKTPQGPKGILGPLDCVACHH